MWSALDTTKKQMMILKSTNNCLCIGTPVSVSDEGFVSIDVIFLFCRASFVVERSILIEVHCCQHALHVIMTLPRSSVLSNDRMPCNSRVSPGVNQWFNCALVGRAAATQSTADSIPVLSVSREFFIVLAFPDLQLNWLVLVKLQLYLDSQKRKNAHNE